MAKFAVFAILVATLVAVALAGEPVKNVKLSEGTDLKTAASFGYGGLGFGYGGYGGWGWGLPLYGWGGWGWGGLGYGGLGYGGYGGFWG